MKKEKRHFEIDANNQFALDFFVSYFSNVEDLKKLGGKPNKGLFIFGNCGTGKSLFFEVLEDIYTEYPNPNYRIKTIHTIELTDKVIGELTRPNQLAPNDRSIYERFSSGSVHFEDLGAERKLNHFGNTIEIMSDIIQLRYKNSRKTNCKTFISTNLTLDKVREKYGERFYDRMFEMYNFIEISGNTRRK